MSCSKSFVDFVLDQARDAGPVRTRAMFGEYALYCEDKVVALICDDQVFLKPTEAGRALIDEPEERPAYPGSKPHLFVPEAILDDPARFAALVVETAKVLPAPKPKKPRTKKKPATN